MSTQLMALLCVLALGAGALFLVAAVMSSVTLSSRISAAERERALDDEVRDAD
jgi:Tfp pilus assembly protein PilX